MSKAFASLRSSRRFTLLLGMVAVLVVGFLMTRPPDALAATLRPQTCTFYSNASLTVIVGHAGYNCNGSISWQSGTITAYKNCTYDYCCCCLQGPYWC